MVGTSKASEMLEQMRARTLKGKLHPSKFIHLSASIKGGAEERACGRAGGEG
jgi:hypothetical protein